MTLYECQNCGVKFRDAGMGECPGCETDNYIEIPEEEAMKISNEGETISFKTREPWYTREKNGLKCNTVRSFSGHEEEQKFINVLFYLLEIEIVEEVTNQSFKRTISDISYFDNNFIFSWFPEEK